MTAALALLTSPLGRWLGGGAFAFAVLIGVFIAGDNHGKHVCQAAQARAVAAATKHMAAADAHIAKDVVAPLRNANIAAQQAIADRTAALTKEIPNAIPQASNCTVPSAAVGLLDAASDLPGVAGSASGPQQAPPDATLSDVVSASIYNDGVAQGALEEDQTWRQWYVKSQQAYDQAVGAKPAQ